MTITLEQITEAAESVGATVDEVVALQDELVNEGEDYFLEVLDNPDLLEALLANECGE